jgi:DNA-directed RNA polymerase specialized sigma subunit
MDTLQTRYDTWKIDPIPEKLSPVLAALYPTINSEIQRYNGPKHVLRGKAKSLALQAVKTYNPTQGTQLRSWVVSNLQPLSRYSQSLRPIKAPEVAMRQAAEVNRLSQEFEMDSQRPPSDDELADVSGLSVKRIKHIRERVKGFASESSLVNDDADSLSSNAPAVFAPNKLEIARDMVYTSLSDRDKRIYEWKTGKNGTQLSNQDIAIRLGVSPAFISQRSSTIAEQMSDLVRRGLV